MPFTLESNICGKPRCLERVSDKNVTGSIQYLTRRCLAMPVLADNKKIGTLAKQPNERLAKQSVFYQQKDADSGIGDGAAHVILLIILPNAKPKDKRSVYDKQTKH
jgi:hypothetical protein